MCVCLFSVGCVLMLLLFRFASLMLFDCLFVCVFVAFRLAMFLWIVFVFCLVGLVFVCCLFGRVFACCSFARLFVLCLSLWLRFCLLVVCCSFVRLLGLLVGMCSVPVACLLFFCSPFVCYFVCCSMLFLLC